jgi:lysozyme
MHPVKISEDGINLVKKFEGLHRVQPDGMVSAYRCPAGKYTCGWGATRGVRSGTKWTKEYCDMRLVEDLADHSKAIKKYVQVPLSQGQFDALTSFVFNLGEGNFRSSTLLKKLNKGLYDDVPEQIMRWNKARVDGKLTPLKGLTRRRAAEAAIFSRDAAMPSDEGGPDMVQKPTAEAPKSLVKSKTMAGVGIAGTATAMNEMAGQLQGLVAYADSLKTIFLVCAIGGIALAAYARWKDNKEGIH